MPAPVAIRFNPDLQANHTALRAAGKPAKLAIIAILRKLLETAKRTGKADRLWVEKTSCA
jgi:transposase